jgi:hypothetical protein
VLQADAAAPESPDWRRLQTLVRRAIPAIEQALLAAAGPVLLVYPGLLAHYDQIQLFERLREACLQRRDAPGFIVLIAADEQGHMPVLDGKPISRRNGRASPRPGWRTCIAAVSRCQRR